jgi:DNA-binding transcriptional regulator GbsR (MarR family)
MPMQCFHFSLDRNDRRVHNRIKLIHIMNLSQTSQQFILHWGEMGARWGVNRTVAQIHALLYLHGKPLPADEIAETLAVARSNVSNSLRELQAWNLVKLVHVLGDRRDHFETSTDIWDLARTIVRERKEREILPTQALLKNLLNSPELMVDGVEKAQRIREMLLMLESLTVWTDEMLRLDTETLSKVLKLGAKIQRLIRGEAEQPTPEKAVANNEAMGSMIGP